MFLHLASARPIRFVYQGGTPGPYEYTPALERSRPLSGSRVQVRPGRQPDAAGEAPPKLSRHPQPPPSVATPSTTTIDLSQESVLESRTRRKPTSPHSLPDLAVLRGFTTERARRSDREGTRSTIDLWYHGPARETPTNPPGYSPSQLHRLLIAAAAMSEERLWKFRKPEWLNSVYARNAGVYSAGALVSLSGIMATRGNEEEMGD